MNNTGRRTACRALMLMAIAALLLWPIPAAYANPGGVPNAHANDRAQGADPTRTRLNKDSDSNDGGTPNNVSDGGDNAHPSSKDRSVEPGASGNQGRAAHDPDDDGNGPDRSNGGLDQPGGPGGVDLADQDGNNGCGNDDDFEDDNEGRCLGRQSPGGPNPGRPEGPNPADPNFAGPGGPNPGAPEGPNLASPGRPNAAGPHPNGDGRGDGALGSDSAGSGGSLRDLSPPPLVWALSSLPPPSSWAATLARLPAKLAHTGMSSVVIVLIGLGALFGGALLVRRSWR